MPFVRRWRPLGRYLPRTEIELQPLKAAELIVNGQATLVEHADLAVLMDAVQVAWHGSRT